MSLPLTQVNGTSLPMETKFKPKQRKPHRQSLCYLAAITGCLVTLVIGFLLGWFLAPTPIPAEQPWQRDLDPARSHQLINNISSDNIRKMLRWMSAMPRLAGSDMTRDYAKGIRQMWLEHGFDTAGIEPLDVTLSLSGNRTQPNKVQILSSDGQILTESPTAERLNHPLFPAPYVAWAKAGISQGDVVYINTGEAHHFELLRNMSINLRGKIGLAYVAQTHLYDMAANAAAHGMTGVIVFPDPRLDATDGATDVFPATWWLPGDAIRMGAATIYPGDISTPRYPSKHFAYRETEEVIRARLCPLPMHPVSYNTALSIFASMADDTPTLPERWGTSWSGSNITWRIGGKMKDGRQVRLEVHNRLEKKTIYNTFGMIKGSIESDRLVIAGSHRDAWVHGAIDSGSGGAVMLELSRSMGSLLKTGWRPRRSILFASWAAEEQGLIGSTEWVQSSLGILQYKAVAYINLDVAVTGSTGLMASASPTLQQLILNISQAIPHTVYDSIYDAWHRGVGKYGGKPQVYPLYPMSDYTAFNAIAGVASMDLYFTSNHPFLYPAYHTEYDTYDYVTKFIDPDMSIHRMVAQLVGEVLHQLVDSRLLPLDVSSYGVQLEMMLQRFKGALNDLDLKWWTEGDGLPLLQQLEYSIHNFSAASESFQHRIPYFNLSDPYRLREVNDQLMLIERAFIDPNFQTDPASIFWHVLMSPNRNCPGNNLFPRVSDVYCDIRAGSALRQLVVADDVRLGIHKQVATVCHALARGEEMLITWSQDDAAE